MRLRDRAAAAICSTLLLSALVTGLGWCAAAEAGATSTTNELSQMWSLRSGLYASKQTTGSTTSMSLLRLDPSTGAVEARSVIGDVGIDDVVQIGTVVVVATAAEAYTDGYRAGQLIVADATNLRVLHRRDVPATSRYDPPELAVSGRSVWVTDGTELLRIDPTNAATIRTISVAGGRDGAAGFESVTSSGNLLLTSLDRPSSRIFVQRRSGTTGALEAQSAALEGIAVTAMSVGDGGAWISLTTGMQGSTERLDEKTLRPSSTPDYPGAKQHPSNAVKARLDGGTLLVTDLEQRDPALDFCADPTTGAELARLPLSDSDLRAATPTTLYLGGTAVSATKVDLLVASVPQRCG